MKEKLYYEGKHMPKGEYEFESKKAEKLLLVPGWKRLSAVKPSKPKVKPIVPKSE